MMASVSNTWRRANSGSHDVELRRVVFCVFVASGDFGGGAGWKMSGQDCRREDDEVAKQGGFWSRWECEVNIATRFVVYGRYRMISGGSNRRTCRLKHTLLYGILL